ncbi:MAG TPA: preprotein translocase subunit SecY [Proteiniclasticum sp.]|jgi:preprotein translocase subunit SecY|uniref:preprotein translocase subunit SecY n=1 Tax=Proteiniclasticum sp. TaxID=2053595 RepID=UPI000E8693EE|nr:preprotein translocase subunit SecY [Proteiniclasticum sp.]HBW14290.1 preprotein translocase subunit SecY [Proteiniclasticum sp.]
MLQTLKNAWKLPDLRKRILFTVFIVFIFRLGNFIVVPNINADALKDLANSQTLVGFYDLISGGAFSNFSIFAMGVTPYINASIIMQLMNVIIPKLEQLSKEGQEGRAKIQNYTKYLAIAIGAVQAYGTYVLIYNAGAVEKDSFLNTVLIIMTLLAASMFLIWLGDRITEKGVGNGVSVLIFINIVSRIPMMATQVGVLYSGGAVDIVSLVLFALAMVALFVGTVAFSLGERRIPVQYAGRVSGTKQIKGQSSHIPVSVSSACVIAIIFAMSVMQFPATLAEFFRNSKVLEWLTTSNWSIFKVNSVGYMVAYVVLVIFFAVFYTQITMKPEDMADNMAKSGGYVAGIRPGVATAKYLERILTKVALIGGVFAALIAVFPIFLEGYTPFKGLAFGGTVIFIMSGVALDTMRQLESQLVMRHYKGFLSK